MKRVGSWRALWAALAITLAPGVAPAQDSGTRVPVNRDFEGFSLGMAARDAAPFMGRGLLWQREQAPLGPPDGRRPDAATVSRGCFQATLDTTKLRTVDDSRITLVFLRAQLLRIEIEAKTDPGVMRAALIEKYGPPQRETYWHFEWVDTATLLQLARSHGPAQSPTRLVYTDRMLVKAQVERLAHEQAAQRAERERERHQTPRSY